MLLVALVVLGPTRLPQAARQLGRAMGEFRRMTSGLQAELRDTINAAEPSSPPSPPPAPGGWKSVDDAEEPRAEQDRPGEQA